MGTFRSPCRSKGHSPLRNLPLPAPVSTCAHGTPISTPITSSLTTLFISAIMAGFFNTNNWKNLFFGKGGGKGKGDGKGDPHDIYKPIEGQRVLSFVDMSNRVQHLCRAHETERADKEEESKLEKSDQRMKQLLVQMGLVDQRKTGKGSASGSAGLETPAKKRARNGAAAIDSLSELNDNDEDEGLCAMAHKEVVMAAKTIEAICEKSPLKVKICIHENKDKPIKLNLNRSSRTRTSTPLPGTRSELRPSN